MDTETIRLQSPVTTTSTRSAHLKKAGFQIARQGRKHVVMSDGTRFLTVPRNNPIHSYTMAGIVRDAGLSIDEFRKLL